MIEERSFGIRVLQTGEFGEGLKFKSGPVGPVEDVTKCKGNTEAVKEGVICL